MTHAGASVDVSTYYGQADSLTVAMRRMGLQGKPYEQAKTAALGLEGRRLYEFDPAKVERGLRGHVDTQNTLAAFLTRHRIDHYSPSIDDPDYDIAWRTRAADFVGEIKSITKGNEERQLRLGLGQLLRYRQKLTAGERQVVAVLVPERQPSDMSWLDLCHSLGVLIDWPPAFEKLVSAMGLNEHQSE